MTRRITDANLGAWLLTCNPEANPDLRRRIAAPETVVVTTWCVADTYRSRMMKPGDRAVLWVSGNGRRLTRGIWGAGWVTGYARDRSGDAPAAASREVSLDIPLVEEGSELSAAELVDAGITDLEVQLQPQMSNPSWLSREQLARVEALLAPWPPHVAPE